MGATKPLSHQSKSVWQKLIPQRSTHHRWCVKCEWGFIQSMTHTVMDCTKMSFHTTDLKVQTWLHNVSNIQMWPKSALVFKFLSHCLICRQNAFQHNQFQMVLENSSPLWTPKEISHAGKGQTFYLPWCLCGFRFLKKIHTIQWWPAHRDIWDISAI